MPTTLISFNDLGITPPAPGLDRTAFWRVTLLEGGSAVSHLFADEPEHRAVEALLERSGANGCMITPPARDTEEA